jgi:hypothetical protein
MRKVLIAIVFTVVVGAIAAGFFLLGTPSEERTRRLDERRLSDLRRLQLATDLYWTRNGRLPLTLDDLAKEAGTGIYSRDPTSGQPYEYRVKDADTYELCVVFEREQPSGGFWSHGAGRRCFEITSQKIRP